MRAWVFAFIVVLAFLQYEIWVGQGGLYTVWQLQHRITAQQDTNRQLAQRNAILAADIQDLKKGTSAVASRARNELGMVKRDEVFFHVVPKQ